MPHARLAQAMVAMRALDVEESNAKSRLMDAEAKLMIEENQIMMTDSMSISDPDQRAWLERGK